MTLFGISEVVVVIHTWFNFYLFVVSGLHQSLSIKSDSLLLVTYGLDAAVVELFQSCWHLDFDSRHRREPWLVDTSKC